MIEAEFISTVGEREWWDNYERHSGERISFQAKLIAHAYIKRIETLESLLIDNDINAITAEAVKIKATQEKMRVTIPAIFPLSGDAYTDDPTQRGT